MRRVARISPAGAWDAASAVDRVVLDSADRHRRRVVLTGERGVRVLVDLPQPVMLHDGDGLILDDGSAVRVVGRPEPLLELAVATPSQFVRLAWHLGNRHTEVQVLGDRLRIRRDHVLRDMAIGLGATVTQAEAPFDPEAGVRSTDDHDHDHSHGLDGRA